MTIPEIDVQRAFMIADSVIENHESTRAPTCTFSRH